MDPLASERAMTYAEPSIMSSRDFVTVQTVERPTDPESWWGPGSRFTISLRNIAQNEFLDANKMRLEFSVMVSVTPPTGIGGLALAPDVNQAERGNGDTRPVPLIPQHRGVGNTLWRGGPVFNASTVGIPAATKGDAAACFPGTPAFGCPFFDSCRVAIPGLALESFLTTQVDSQLMFASRLLCSSGDGVMDADVGPLSYRIPGEPELAGARSAMDRMACVTAQKVRTNRCSTYLAVGHGKNGATAGPAFQVPKATADADANPHHWIGPDALVEDSWDRAYSFAGLGYPIPTFNEGEVYTRGSLVHYSVPLSAFSHLFNASSNLIPLGYYSTSADTCQFTFNVAPATIALNNMGAHRQDMCGPASFWVIDPCISFTKLQISNPTILTSIETLYRGAASIPIAPGMDIPLAMVMKFINYVAASVQVAGLGETFSQKAFHLQIPANQPSMRGIMIRFTALNYRNAGIWTGTLPQNYLDIPSYTADGVQPILATLVYPPWRGTGVSMDFQNFSEGLGDWNGRFLLSLVPLLRNFQLKIASYRVPLDSLSDSELMTGSFPRGLTFNPFADAELSSVTEPDFTSPRYDPIATTSVFTNYNYLRGDFTAPPLNTPMPFISRTANRLYRQGRHLFSLFASEEHPHQNALSPFYSHGHLNRQESATHQLFAGQSLVTPKWDKIGVDSFMPAPVDYTKMQEAPTGDSAVLATSKVVRLQQWVLWNSQVWSGIANAIARSRLICGQTRQRFPRTTLDNSATEPRIPLFDEHNNFRALSGTQDYVEIPDGVGLPPEHLNLRPTAPAGIAANSNIIFPAPPDVDQDQEGDAFNFREFAGTVGADVCALPHWSSPGLVVIPFESLSPIYNHQDDAFTLRGLDLRSITSIDVTGEVTGWWRPVGAGNGLLPGGDTYDVLPDGTGIKATDQNLIWGASASSPGKRDRVYADTLQIRAWVAFDHEHVLLPGRTDVEAQFSLIPTGATAIPSGGAPAM